MPPVPSSGSRPFSVAIVPESRRLSPADDGTPARTRRRTALAQISQGCVRMSSTASWGGQGRLLIQFGSTQDTLCAKKGTDPLCSSARKVALAYDVKWGCCLDLLRALALVRCAHVVTYGGECLFF